MYPKQNKQVAANIITAIIRITLLCNHKSVKTNKIDTNNCKMKTPRNIPETYSDSGIDFKLEHDKYMFTPNSVKNDITFANRFICFNLCRDMIVINVRWIIDF